MTVLGVNAFHGDSSAALLRDGELCMAVEEERYNRVKHWAGLPAISIQNCLAGESPDHLAISRDPRAHFLSKLLRVATRPQDWSHIRSRAVNSVRVSRVRADLEAAQIINPHTKFHFVEHHRAHLASAFFCSPFEEA